MSEARSGLSQLKGVVVGAGYFSRFHFDAWSRMDDVHIAAVCELDAKKREATAREFSIPQQYSSFGEMLQKEKPDFVDIVTRPDSHLALVQESVLGSVPVICQKALAPTFSEAQRIVQVAAEASVPLMVHENFRFQPWYREIKAQLDRGSIGDRLHNVTFRCRTGDGWGSDAYLDRQPYFREMPRLLIFETGVHFVDTFRFLAGEIASVFGKLRRFNQEIAGEDAATVFFDFENGANGWWDGNRYNEPTSEDARFTFGEALVEAEGGSIRLYGDGRLTLQALGEPEREIKYDCPRRGFAGDCVFNTQRHFVDCLRQDLPFETSGAEYLKTLQVVEAIYDSAEQGQLVFCQGGAIDARH